MKPYEEYKIINKDNEFQEIDGLILTKDGIRKKVISPRKGIIDEEPTDKNSLRCKLGIHNWCRCTDNDGKYVRYCIRCGYKYEIYTSYERNIRGSLY